MQQEEPTITWNGFGNGGDYAAMHGKTDNAPALDTTILDWRGNHLPPAAHYTSLNDGSLCRHRFMPINCAVRELLTRKLWLALQLLLANHHCLHPRW